ncbi:hypothetical protein SCALM49S_05933 [Streptomyces californicus]
MSTKTGTRPFWMIGLTVVGNPAATVITSSPGRSLRSPSTGEVRAVSARRFAEEPELVRCALRSPSRRANADSNFRQSEPAAIRIVSAASTSATRSFASSTAPEGQISVTPGSKRPPDSCSRW